MKTNLPVISFIETSHQNKEFFNQKFIPEMLANANGRKPKTVFGFSDSNENYQSRLDDWVNIENTVLFEDWVCKKRTNWIDFKNNDNKIEFYSKTYKINGVELPFPQTIDQFIIDCKRLNVDVFWRKDLVELNININHIVDAVVAKEYINELLVIMDKL